MPQPDPLPEEVPALGPAGVRGTVTGGPTPGASHGGALRLSGEAATERGRLVVSGFETLDGRAGVVERIQYHELFDRSGVLLQKRLLPMRFALPTMDEVGELVRRMGFEPVAIYGDYDRGEYRARSSPRMVWTLVRRGTP